MIPKEFTFSDMEVWAKEFKPLRGLPHTVMAGKYEYDADKHFCYIIAIFDEKTETVHHLSFFRRTDFTKYLTAMRDLCAQVTEQQKEAEVQA